MYINLENIKKDSIQKRQYQINIANSAKKENTLVVLPTGLGKTIIALILIANHLKIKNNKILFLSPTKPLVSQHAQFLKEYLDIDKEKISIFTGEVSPKKRKETWENSKIIISTPQVIQNDLLSHRFDLKDVSLIIFDECHHAVGDYAYVFVSEMYQKQRKEKLVLGMTASPGNDFDKIMEVCKNLDIKNVEIRTKWDSDVKPYAHPLDIKWKEIDLPNDFAYTVQLLRKALSERLKRLKEINVVESASVSNINKTKLLEAQRKIQKEIKSRVKPPKVLFEAASIQSQAMKIHYALELIQTQGANAFLNYFQRLGKEINSKKSTKSSKYLMKDNSILESIAYAKNINLEHPKVKEVEKIVIDQIKTKKDSKMIIFTHFRDTAAYIVENLEKRDGVKAIRFVGQANKEGDKGLTQKQQVEIIKKFKKGEFNVLIATSVAEEGLDIPSTDLVVFYEPIPSEIRLIQRRGRTARETPGKVIILITKGTSDQGYYWSAKRKEKRMQRELEKLRNKLDKRFEDAKTLYKKEIEQKNNQKTLMDYGKKPEKINIIIDNREYRSNVAKNLMSKDISIEPSQLDVGDYIVSSRIGVERKNVDDFLDSLINGNLFKQMSRLKESYSRPVLILEGENIFTKRNINQNAIFGSLASITIDFGIPVLTTKNEKETADLLGVMAKREQKTDKKSIIIRGDKPQMSLIEQQRYLVEGLPNVSAVLAKRLLNHFGSIRDIANASIDELKQVHGIGEHIASDIVNLFTAEYLSK